MEISKWMSIIFSNCYNADPFYFAVSNDFLSLSQAWNSEIKYLDFHIAKYSNDFAEPYILKMFLKQAFIVLIIYICLKKATQKYQWTLVL